MTRQAFRVQTDHLRSLRGDVCVRATTGAGPWALLLDFGMLHPLDATGDQAPEKALVVGCPWRLETAAAVLGTSDDGYSSEHGPAARSPAEMAAALPVCVGKHTVFRPSFMVRLLFSGALRLWAFPMESRAYQDDRGP